MSPPAAPTPDTALGCPRYSRPQPEAPLPPSAPRPRHSSLPPPRPFSEPRNTLSDRETWIAGSPAMLVPQPVLPTLPVPSSPYEKLPTVSAEAAAGITAAPALAKSASVATVSERVQAKHRADTQFLLKVDRQRQRAYIPRPRRRKTSEPCPWPDAHRPRRGF